MAADWIGIASTDLMAGGVGVGFCGEELVYAPTGALDGTGIWVHEVNETHWFVIDLGIQYNVTKVRGRSNSGGGDPTDVNIYVSDDIEDWGAAVGSGIDTWRNIIAWVEVDTTDKNGRYVKVEIITTADVTGNCIIFGNLAMPFTIFDVYGEATGGVANYFDGLIDNVMLFDTTLNIDEVKALYHGGHGTEIVEVIDLDRRIQRRQ